MWPQTVRELSVLIRGRGPSEQVFLTRRGQPITRFGIHTLVERAALRAWEIPVRCGLESRTRATNVWRSSAP